MVQYSPLCQSLLDFPGGGIVNHKEAFQRRTSLTPGYVSTNEAPTLQTFGKKRVRVQLKRGGWKTKRSVESWVFVKQKTPVEAYLFGSETAIKRSQNHPIG